MEIIDFEQIITVNLQPHPNGVFKDFNQVTRLNLAAPHRIVDFVAVMNVSLVDTYEPAPPIELIDWWSDTITVSIAELDPIIAIVDFEQIVNVSLSEEDLFIPPTGPQLIDWWSDTITIEPKLPPRIVDFEQVVTVINPTNFRMATWFGIDGVAHEVERAYIGIDGVAHEIRSLFTGDGTAQAVVRLERK